MSYRNRVWVGLLCIELGLLGCSSPRDVEVSGKVTAPSSSAVGDKVVLEFIDVIGEGSSVEREVVHSTQLSAPGDFKETVLLEGDRVQIWAFDDRNGDKNCSPGEAWGQTEGAVDGDKVEVTDLMLSTGICPQLHGE
jgi:hypothetical protein